MGGREKGGGSLSEGGKVVSTSQKCRCASIMPLCRCHSLHRLSGRASSTQLFSSFSCVGFCVDPGNTSLGILMSPPGQRLDPRGCDPLVKYPPPLPEG